MTDPSAARPVPPTPSHHPSHAPPIVPFSPSTNSPPSQPPALALALSDEQLLTDRPSLETKSVRSGTHLRPTLFYSLSAESRTSGEIFPAPASSASREASPTSRSSRSTSRTRSGFLSFAALAREKTSSAFSGFSSRQHPTSASSVRSASSANNLTSLSSTSSILSNEPPLPPLPPREPNTTIDVPASQLPEEQRPRLSKEESVEKPSRSSSTVCKPTVGISSRRRSNEDDPATPFELQVDPKLKSVAYGNVNKMHQTSSRLLRMTDEERPFTRDFKDLFSTLMVSLPLTSHRIRLQKVSHTFTSEEAINNLGSLKFSQSNRMPDPKDSSRIVTTTTTTTFSMAREMARSVCQRFLDARFIEAADGKLIYNFPLKGSVWQLTPKGMHILQRFCQRNGINQKHIMDVLESPRNSMQLVILERDAQTDKLSHDRATIEVIFRRFVGQDGPNLKLNTSSSDSDSLSDYANGLVGVKMAKERKIADKVVPNTFTGKATVDWLMDCCDTIDRGETCEVAKTFLTQGLVASIAEDKLYIQHNPDKRIFQPTKAAIYSLTEKGQRVAGWLRRSGSEERDTELNGVKDLRITPRDSNTNRLTVILSDPALRLLFREFLRDTHCEENMAFYLDVVEFTTAYKMITRKGMTPKIDTIRESLAAAYGLYNAFLAPGSPCELNIDHNLRNNLAGRMTRAVGDDEAMINSLKDVAKLFDEAQNSVFKLMSSDSVPKFLKDPKYAPILKEHDYEATLNGQQPASSGTSSGSHTKEWSPLPPQPAVTKPET